MVSNPTSRWELVVEWLAHRGHGCRPERPILLIRLP
jgi:hypothetical protein